MSDPYNNIGSTMKNVVKLPVKRRSPLPNADWSAWERMRKIARFSGYNRSVRVDPVQVAAATLEKAQAGRMKSIFVSIQWDDDSLSVDWSQMPRSALFTHAFNVQSAVQEEVGK